MNVAIQVPLKAKQSLRVPNKNFRNLNGKPLCFWLLDELVRAAPIEWRLFVDSESPKVMERLSSAHRARCAFHQRHPWFASDDANGNHLIHQFAACRPDFDLYVQAYVTAVTLTGRILVEAVQALIDARDRYDSLFLATEETGWFWKDGQALNYDPTRPDGLPRSQDAALLKETTGLYAITRDAVFRCGCRIGRRPLPYRVSRACAIDIDTIEDFYEAERLLKRERSEPEARH